MAAPRQQGSTKSGTADVPESPPGCFLLPASPRLASAPMPNAISVLTHRQLSPGTGSGLWPLSQSLSTQFGAMPGGRRGGCKRKAERF